MSIVSSVLARLHRFKTTRHGLEIWLGDGVHAPIRLSEVTTALKDAERYAKLRRWMGSNVPEGWREVENLASVACYVGWDDFDKYLDSMPECNVGLCEERK